MQNFYKVTQGNHEKVPSFATRLEGTFNQTQLKCSRWIAVHEVPWHLKDHLFHEDSIRYLYSNPAATYSELLVAAQKAESETEEAQDKVRAKSAVIAESVDGCPELSNQITRLMAALTRAEQGNHPASAPNSPRHQGHWRGWMDRNTPNHLSSHNGWIGLGQTTSACSASVHHMQNATSTGAPDSKAQGSTRGTTSKMEPSSLQCFRCQGWGHMAQECATLAKSLNPAGGNWGNVTPPPLAAANSRHPAFPPWPWTTMDHLKGTQKKGQSKVPLLHFWTPTQSLGWWAIPMKPQWLWMGKKQLLL